MHSTSAIEHTAEIVSAYVANNRVPASELPSLMATIHAALSGVTKPIVPVASPARPEVKKPSAAEIRASITPEALISFEDGQPYQMLRRHLGGRGLTPETYRAKWGLPFDYPMVAVNFAAERSAIAKRTGLGNFRRKK